MIEAGIFQIFTRIVQDALRDDSIVLSTQTTAREVKGWDSLKQVLIIMEVEEKFGITLHSREIDSIKCVGDFVAVIGRKAKRQIDGSAEAPADNMTEAPRLRVLRSGHSLNPRALQAPAHFMMTLPQVMQQALAAYSQRDWGEAERLARDILDKRPDYSDALNLLGIIAAQTGRTLEAAALLERVVAANPGNALAYNNRGIALHRLKRLDDALDSYDRALKINPDYAEAYSNRGITLQELERLDEALDSCAQALRIKPDNAEAHNNRGITLQKLKRLSEALDSYDRALRIKPDYVEAYSNRGMTLHDLKRLNEALVSYDRALGIDPEFAEAHNNRANTLHELRRLNEALDSYDRALRIKPEYAEAHFSRGNALRELGRLDEALESCEHALRIKPDYAEAHFASSIWYLLAGDLARGWEGYEWRWQIGSYTSAKRNFPQPLWLGEESLAGKTILLHSEQGLGDALQFCRYAKLVADLGARVIMEVHKPLVTLFTALEGVAQLVERGGALPMFDYQCPLMSLPLAFKTDLSSVPAPNSYLKADAAKSLSWKMQLGTKTKFRVGLVWSGGVRPDHLKGWGITERRNIKLSKLAPLKNESIDFYSLQKGRPAERELAELKESSWDGPEIIDFADELIDFSDTAALIDNLDLVISVDTSVAHLAGALGKPVWILNRFDTCWRWMLNREDSPWYQSVRLFRQERADDWDGVVARVRHELMQQVFQRQTNR